LEAPPSPIVEHKEVPLIDEPGGVELIELSMNAFLDGLWTMVDCLGEYGVSLSLFEGLESGGLGFPEGLVKLIDPVPEHRPLEILELETGPELSQPARQRDRLSSEFLERVWVRMARLADLLDRRMAACWT
jgi:hypothetical protein